MYYNTISIECFCFRSLVFKYLCITFRVRQNLDKDFILIDLDPGKAYTRVQKQDADFVLVRSSLKIQKAKSPKDWLQIQR